MLAWIVFNRTVYMYKNLFGIKLPTMVEMAWSQTKPNQTKANQTEATADKVVGVS